MQFSLPLVVVTVTVVGINAQLVFYPAFAPVSPIFTPGSAGFASSSRGNAPTYRGTEGRVKTLQGVAGAEDPQGDAWLGTVGSGLNPTSFSNPFLGFRSDFSRSKTRTVAVPTVCVACTCLVGFKTCAEAGGRIWGPGVCFGAPTAPVGAECSFPSPPTLSACDPTCVKSCVATAAGSPPGLFQCTPIDPTDKKQCNTPCGSLTKGAIVKCNSAYPEVISKVPSLCNNGKDRLKRHANFSTPTSEAARSQFPEIQSSHQTSSDRNGRALVFGLAANPRVDDYPITNIVRASVTATYVAANGVCLPDILADASVC